MKGKIFKTIRRILKLIFIGFILPILILIFCYAAGVRGDLYNILMLLALSYMYMVLMISLFFASSKKSKFNKKYTLYQWTDELIDYNDRLEYALKHQQLSINTLENLNNIKSILMVITNRKKESLRMYLAYYSQQLKESSEELYLKSVITFLIPISTFVLRDYIPKVEGFETYSFFFVILIIFITIAVISDKLISNKKRIGIIMEIISICIEEIEQEEKKKGEN
ncbi:hypothetical protein ABE096_14030 [Robertmurraya massiliosenegalensis]|uniref:hypothetical protein n=1 Tax=Robertmurraya TaxID=2837507 RepID=UPI0039A6EAFB